MSTAQMALRNQQAQYNKTVVDYITKNGRIFALSDDQIFLSLLRMSLAKGLGIKQPEVLTCMHDSELFRKELYSQYSPQTPPLVFIERQLMRQDLSGMVKEFKAAFAAIHIIALTDTAEKNRLMLLHEVGADSMIIKPVSMNSLIEKMAFTLKPQSKLGQIIDAAKLALAEERPQDALRLCNEIIRLKPNSATGLLVRGDAYMALGELESAREAYETASKNADMYLEPLLRLVDFYTITGNVERRLYYLQMLNQLSPLNAERKVEIGEIYLQANQHDKAEQFFTEAIERASRDAANLARSIGKRIASVYEKTDPELANKYLQKSLEHIPANALTREDAAVLNRLGLHLRRQGLWKEALAEYKKAIKITPNDEFLYYNVGMAYATGKDFKQACTFLLKALKMNKNLPQSSASTAYNMGIILMREKHYTQAKYCLELSLESDPSNEHAQKALAMVLQQ